ncbi:hypothetical protein [Halorussus ruber]|uniref:hypothetical protein n=1 Tax=Halorussus ruber TaxID=1126238 RepID=UPI001092EB14|nr:hypothetical protein [Halorussus ruber]
MRRRDTLRRCAVLGATGGLALLAGCSGGGGGDGGSGGGDESAESSLSVETFNYEEGDDGALVVTVSVTNAGDSSASGKLYVTVSAAEPTAKTETTDDGDDTTAARESLDVTVPAGETKTVEVPFEFTVEQFEQDGSLEVDLRA